MSFTQISYGRFTAKPRGKCEIDLFIMQADGKKIVDPNKQNSLSSRLRMELLRPLRVAIVSRGPDTELLVSNPVELSGKGRPLVFYDITLALKMLDTCIFLVITEICLICFLLFSEVIIWFCTISYLLTFLNHVWLLISRRQFYQISHTFVFCSSNLIHLCSLAIHNLFSILFFNRQCVYIVVNCCNRLKLGDTWSEIVSGRYIESCLMKGRGYLFHGTRLRREFGKCWWVGSNAWLLSWHHTL